MIRPDTTHPAGALEASAVLEALGAQITEEEMARNGRTTPVIAGLTVSTALARIHASGILYLLETWQAQDHDPDVIGSRPRQIGPTAILTGLLLLACETRPLHLTLLTDLFLYRLTDTDRALLGLPETRPAADPHREYERWYANTSRALHRILDLMDPFPQERYRAKTYTQISDILDQHDPERERRYRDRLNDFTHAFLAMTYQLQPRWLRRARGALDISFDQTYLRSPTRKGFSRRTLTRHVKQERGLDPRTLAPGPVDAFCGWHVKEGARTDYTGRQTDQTAPTKSHDTNYLWGWVANLAVRVDSVTSSHDTIPGIIVAASLSLPNKEVAEEAIDLMRHTLHLDPDLAPGIADADKQYWANALPERLHQPAHTLGYTASTDYRSDQLEPTAGQHGAIMLEGRAYHPGTPRPLLTATKDYHDHLIDKTTFKTRKQELGAYELHRKETKLNGTWILTCPGQGPSPTIECPCHPLDPRAPQKPRPRIDEADMPPRDLWPRICTQKSCAFDPELFLRKQQAFPYGSDKWERFHRHARNSIESTNAQLKRGGSYDLHSAARRRIRGFAAAQTLTTLIITAFNIRKITQFVADHTPDGPIRPRPTHQQRRRDREHYNPYTGSYPPGTTPPPGTQPQRT